MINLQLIFKNIVKLYFSNSQRMSMMRLRRQYVPAYGNNRVTRGMGNVSMLRLRRAMAAPSLMRLKKMTQMRLKRMTQMRLKKSGVPQFEDEFEEDLGDVVSKYEEMHKTEKQFYCIRYRK